MELKQVILVLVDISGYTNFLRYRTLSLLHAEDIITQLLESVIDAADYPLTLNKLEGDAAFLYAPLDGERAMIAQDVLRQVQGFFSAFRQKTAELEQDTAHCDCDACTRIDTLRLKAFLHSGEVVVKRVRQFEELAGEAVILIHRLLKNSLAADEYVMLSDAFSTLTGDMESVPTIPHVEPYDESGDLHLKVYFPPQNLPPLAQPSAKRKFSRVLARWRRFLAQFVRRTPAANFAHIPNKRLGLGALIRDILSAMRT